MRHYELLVILKPTLTDEEKATQVDFLKNLLEKNGALLEALEDKGTRNLAYEIEKNKRGHYFVLYFKSPAKAIAEIERLVRLNENIIKFMTVKYENKKEIAFWEKLTNNVNKKNQKEIKKTEEQKEEPKTAQE